MKHDLFSLQQGGGYQIVYHICKWKVPVSLLIVYRQSTLLRVEDQPPIPSYTHLFLKNVKYICRSEERVCGGCMEGEFLPVFRPSIRRWSFGQVLEHRRDGNHDLQFRILFEYGDGSNTEWCKVHPKPFEAYITYHRTSETSLVIDSDRTRANVTPKRYDDTPFPLENIGATSVRNCYHHPPPASIRTTTQTMVKDLRPLSRGGTYQSYWRVPYTPSKFRTPEFDVPTPHFCSMDVS
jgi:hypothetical protein